MESAALALVAFRRSRKGFVRETQEGLSAMLRLPAVGCELPLAEIYEGVEHPRA